MLLNWGWFSWLRKQWAELSRRVKGERLSCDWLRGMGLPRLLTAIIVNGKDLMVVQKRPFERCTTETQSKTVFGFCLFCLEWNINALFIMKNLLTKARMRLLLTTSITGPSTISSFLDYPNNLLISLLGSKLVPSRLPSTQQPEWFLKHNVPLFCSKPTIDFLSHLVALESCPTLFRPMLLLDLISYYSPTYLLCSSHPEFLAIPTGQLQSLLKYLHRLFLLLSVK